MLEDICTWILVFWIIVILGVLFALKRSWKEKEQIILEKDTSIRCNCCGESLYRLRESFPAGLMIPEIPGCWLSLYCLNENCTNYGYKANVFISYYTTTPTLLCWLPSEPKLSKNDPRIKIIES